MIKSLTSKYKCLVVIDTQLKEDTTSSFQVPLSDQVS